jgi:hypothetical protein
LTNIKQMYRRSICCKLQRNRSADSATRASNDSILAVKPELGLVCIQRETPRFQGMKSS